MTTQKTISVGELKLGNEKPFVLVGGINVIESENMALKVAETFRSITERLGIPYIFKASFDKANRSSIDSFRGPGLDKGLRILEKIKIECNVPILTDVHEPQQAAPAAGVVDILQPPAFLSRHTDFVVSLAKTNPVLNIQKAQFLSHKDMGNLIKQCENSANPQLILCELATRFAYLTFVVGILVFSLLQVLYYPVLFDVTHSLQQPGGLGNAAGGRRESVRELALAGLSQKIAGLFLEAHPEPEKALCDGPCALRLNQLEPFLQQMKAMDDLVKTFEPLATS